MQTNIVGWDVGGAHIKAALLDTDGTVISVMQKACPLWKGMEFLEKTVTSILETLPNTPCRHVLTMTGELVDLFDSRDQGVARIISSMSALVPDTGMQVYAGRSGFLDVDSVLPEHYPDIASANWLASASYVAETLGDGLFIDIGSTTTDIILLSGSLVQAEGLTDYQRLVSGELVYTGVVRTAVMAVAREAFFKGSRVGLMAEYFATMADVYRLTGELDEAHDQADTADGGDKTIGASARRLSRMIGYEYDSAMLADWKLFASNLRTQQLNLIQQGCEKQMSRGCLVPRKPMIGAGVGRFLVKQLAANLGCDYIDFNELLPQGQVESGMTSADCAPAIAIALLARAKLT
ncbi:MAG: hydantoinase/oxoprolinase family protein [Gammaproteobacteria bacterium]